MQPQCEHCVFRLCQRASRVCAARRCQRASVLLRSEAGPSDPGPQTLGSGSGGPAAAQRRRSLLLEDPTREEPKVSSPVFALSMCNAIDLAAGVVCSAARFPFLFGAIPAQAFLHPGGKLPGFRLSSRHCERARCLCQGLPVSERYCARATRCVFCQGCFLWHRRGVGPSDGVSGPG